MVKISFFKIKYNVLYQDKNLYVTNPIRLQSEKLKYPKTSEMPKNWSIKTYPTKPQKKLCYYEAFNPLKCCTSTH